MGKLAKVFVGPSNTAGVASQISNALRIVGIEADGYTYSYHPFNYGNLKKIPLFKKGKLTFFNKFLRYIYLLYFIIKYKTFIFISPKTIVKNNKDLIILKLLRKKIAFIFPGCTERDPFFQRENPKYVCNRCNDIQKQKICLCLESEKKRKRVKYFEKYADIIFSQDDCANFLNRPFEWFFITCEPMEKNRDEILKKYRANSYKIYHIPSNRKLKGTNTVEKVFVNLKSKYPKMDFKIIENKPNKEILELLENCHIIIDQFTGGHGVLAVEAMSRGCNVIGYIDEWFRNKRPDLPVVSSKEEELEKTLVKLIENKNFLYENGKKSIEYYEKHHAPEAVGEYYKQILKLKT
ncbi:MAG: glycosyltransferase [Methanosarcinales archaeon]